MAKKTAKKSVAKPAGLKYRPNAELCCFCTPFTSLRRNWRGELLTRSDSILANLEDQEPLPKFPTKEREPNEGLDGLEFLPCLPHRGLLIRAHRATRLRE